MKKETLKQEIDEVHEFTLGAFEKVYQIMKLQQIAIGELEERVAWLEEGE